MLNAAALLLEGHEAGRAALCCADRTMSRGELRDAVARCAGLWRARGPVLGERVAIKLSDGCDWVVAFLGAVWAGAIAVAVNPRLPAAEWQTMLDEAGFNAILAETDEDTPMPWRWRVLRLDDWRQELARSVPVEARPLPADAPALGCHSSGTSGQAKMVLHPHRFALQVEQVSRDGLGLRAEDRLFASSKLFFVYPQANSLFAGLKLGATVILDASWPSAASVAATVAAQRATVLFSVPSLYRNLLHQGLAPAIAAAGVRLCVSAGEALPAKLRAAWQEQTGRQIINGYGASETMVLVLLERDGEHGFEPSPGVQVRPLDESSAAAPTRLLIAAPTLALGYLNRPQAQAESFRGAAFCPADLFTAHDSDRWRFAGREDTLVKICGRWVDLMELEENLVSRSAGLLEAAAVCVPDGDGVAALALFYVASDAAMAALDLRQAAATLPHYQRPRWLHPLHALPRTATGKLLRRSLLELHAGSAKMMEDG